MDKGLKTSNICHRELQKRNADEIMVFTVLSKLFKYTFRIAKIYNAKINALQIWMRYKKGRVFYLGYLKEKHVLHLTDNSELPAGHLAYDIFSTTLSILRNNKPIPEGLEIYPSCFRCTRRLTRPEDIARGFGPECAKYMDKYGQTW